jgi:DNA-binding MarR family transcriptional regulator
MKADGPKHGAIAEREDMRSIASRSIVAGGIASGAPAGVDLSVLDASLGYLLRRAQLAVFDDFIRAFAAIGLRPAQFSVLVVVDANPGLKQSDIAAALGIQRTNFVAMMDGLQRRGLVTRALSKSDRRSYSVKLSPNGRALLRQALALHADHEARMLESLGDQSAPVIQSLRSLAQCAAPPNADATRSAGRWTPVVRSSSPAR